jgi:hypothetical protein
MHQNQAECNQDSRARLQEDKVAAARPQVAQVAAARYKGLNTDMKLYEFFTYGADGFEQDKTYEPENDISVLDSEDTRKTRLSLKDINSMRLASEAHDAQQKEEAVFVQKMYGQPATDDNLEL